MEYLTKEFIENQVSESAFPEKVWKSIRGSYEGLDRPAAPFLAFGKNNYFEATIEDERIDGLIAKLNKRGLRTVKSTDPEAKNPDVFVIDIEQKCISAPFLNPQDALKSNIIMLEEIYNENLFAARSSPLTRQNLVKASDKNLSPSERMDRTGKKVLDLEIVATTNNKDKYNETIDSFVDHFISDNCYNNFNKVMKEIQQKDSSLCLRISEEAKNKAAPYIAQGIFNKQRDLLSKDIMQSHRDELKPYIKHMYQDIMIEEAFNQGSAIKTHDIENIQHLQQNGVLKSVFHAGQNGANPYSILAKDSRMCFTYGSSFLAAEDIEMNGTVYQPWGCAKYVFGDSSHNGKAYRSDKYQYGFCYEYDSRGDKQEFIWNEGTFSELEVCEFKGGKFDISRLNNDKDETAIFPHQNKLKAIYIAIENSKSTNLERRMYRLDIDDNGQIKDERWRDFVELHNPVDDNLKGYMIDRRNNMIADYDATGKEKMMDRHITIKTELYSTTKEHKLSDKEKIAALSGRSGGKTNYTVTTEEVSALQQTAKNERVDIVPAPQKSDSQQSTFSQSTEQQDTLSIEPQEKVANMDKKQKWNFFKNLRMGVNTILAKAEAKLSPTKTLEQTNIRQQPSIIQMKVIKDKGNSLS